jgi:hypothetical protein
MNETPWPPLKDAQLQSYIDRHRKAKDRYHDMLMASVGALMTRYGIHPSELIEILASRTEIPPKTLAGLDERMAALGFPVICKDETP